APIVASDLDAFRQVLRGGRAGELFTTGDPSALAAAAGRLLDDPPLRTRLSAAASEAARAYDWPVVAPAGVEVDPAGVAAAGEGGGRGQGGGGAVSALTVAVIVICAAILAGAYVSWRAGRVDRLHARVETARAALDAALVRRSAVALELAACGLLDPATSLLV